MTHLPEVSSFSFVLLNDADFPADPPSDRLLSAKYTRRRRLSVLNEKLRTAREAKKMKRESAGQPTRNLSDWISDRDGSMSKPRDPSADSHTTTRSEASRVPDGQDRDQVHVRGTDEQ
jgi:hypothetical protein